MPLSKNKRHPYDGDAPTAKLLITFFCICSSIILFLSIVNIYQITGGLRKLSLSGGLVSAHSKGGVVTDEEDISWINTSGITLLRFHGDRRSCRDIIYTADTRVPTRNEKSPHVKASWDSHFHIIQTYPIFNQTCLAFFQLSNETFGNEGQLHSVWGRLPATIIAMSYFPAASYLLYMDSDAILMSPDYTPTSMYSILAYDSYGPNATFKKSEPGLIVNKPMRGWLCNQCHGYGLGEACFNSGALLWKRSNASYFVLREWWESQFNNKTQNFLHDDEQYGYFYGWSGDNEHYYSNQQSEQNRLMYTFYTNPDFRRAVWPVPRQVSTTKGPTNGSSSCPDVVDEGHWPCLQNDNHHVVVWNLSRPACFISHYSIANAKQLLVNTSENILHWDESTKI